MSRRHTKSKQSADLFILDNLLTTLNRMQLFAELVEASDWKDFKNKNDVAMFSRPSDGKLDIYMRTMKVATDVSLLSK